MAWAPFTFPTPTENDPIVFYAAGSRLGLDVSVGNWIVRSGQYPYVRGPTSHAYKYDDTQGNALEEGATIIQWANPVSINQWCACQSVIPIDKGGWATGVRVDASANNGYFLQCIWTVEDPSNNTIWSLSRRRNGVDTVLWTLRDNTDANPSDFGLEYTDGMFLILEVKGTDPSVAIRATVAPCRQRATRFVNSYTIFPTDVPISSGTYNPGGQAFRVLCEVTDSSADRLTTGNPGMGVVGPGSVTVADAMYNFNAGAIVPPSVQGLPICDQYGDWLPVRHTATGLVVPIRSAGG